MRNLTTVWILAQAPRREGHGIVPTIPKSNARKLHVENRLKEKDGGPILVAGSRTLVHTLMKHDLVDEYRLMIFPVAVGSGRRLFPDTQNKTVLRLADTRTFSSGVVVHSYEAVSR